MGKTGLVVEGGGMKCAYSAGVLDAFLDHNITFQYGIGVSAGAACLASFQARQRGRNLRFYTKHMNSWRYFGAKSFLTTGDLFGLKYIYGTLSNSDGGDPLDFQAMKKNPMEYYAVATHAESGMPVYFNKKLMHQDDYRHIMASCALPVVCRPVEIAGQHFYDGGVSDSIPVKRAEEDGCDRLVVILSKPEGFVKTPEKHRPMYTAACHKYPNTVMDLNRRHIMYKGCQKELEKLERAGRAIVFRPDVSIKVSTYTMDVEIEQKLYDAGLRDGNAQAERIRTFLS